MKSALLSERRARVCDFGGSPGGAAGLTSGHLDRWAFALGVEAFRGDGLADGRVPDCPEGFVFRSCETDGLGDREGVRDVDVVALGRPVTVAGSADPVATS